MYIYIYIYIHKYLHTYIHLHIYIYIVLFACKAVKPSYFCLNTWDFNSLHVPGRYINGMIMGYECIFIGL